MCAPRPVVEVAPPAIASAPCAITLWMRRGRGRTCHLRLLPLGWPIIVLRPAALLLPFALTLALAFVACGHMRMRRRASRDATPLTVEVATFTAFAEALDGPSWRIAPPNSCKNNGRLGSHMP